MHKAIDREPAHRYATAGELAADLQRFLDDEPIQARRQTSGSAAARARRNPGIAVLGAALTAVLVLVAVGSLDLRRPVGRVPAPAARPPSSGPPGAGRAAPKARGPQAPAERRRRPPRPPHQAIMPWPNAEENFARLAGR